MEDDDEVEDNPNPSKMSVQNFSTFQISQLWDLIETWGFREDLPLVFPHDPS